MQVLLELVREEEARKASSSSSSSSKGGLLSKLKLGKEGSSRDGRQQQQ
jgi:hypothetical protein